MGAQQLLDVFVEGAEMWFQLHGSKQHPPLPLAVPSGGAFGVAGKQATQFSLFIDFLKYLGRAILPCREGGGSAGVAMAMGMWLAPPGPAAARVAHLFPAAAGGFGVPWGVTGGPGPPGASPYRGKAVPVRCGCFLCIMDLFYFADFFFFFFQEEFSAW